ncbi:MAG: SLC13 family permease [Chloroflexota bacterium]
MNGKRWILPGLGIILLILFSILPPMAPITPRGMKVIGTFLFTVTWWVSFGTGFPSLLCLAILAITSVMTPKEVFAVSWGNYLVMFVIGALGLIESLRATGFANRFAFWFMSRPFNEGRPWVMLSVFFLANCLTGAFMESSAVCLIFFAIAEPMLIALGCEKGDKLGATVIMGIGWVSIAAMIMTPIGHGSNLVLLDWIQRDFNYRVGFPQWFAIGFPTGVMYTLIIIAYFRFVVRPDVSRFGGAFEYVRQERIKLGTIKLEEKIALSAFLIVAVFWLLPDLGRELVPELSSYVSTLTYAVPPLIGAGLLCAIRVKKQPLLTFRSWMAAVPWATVALIGAIQALRGPLEDPATGIPTLLNNVFTPLLARVPLMVFLLIGILWTVFQTQFMSNFVTVTLTYTAMMPAIIAAKAGNPMAIAFTLWFAARAAVATPSATSSVALAAGSGWVPVGFLMKWGFLLVIPFTLFYTFIVYPMATLIFR